MFHVWRGHRIGGLICYSLNYAALGQYEIRADLRAIQNVAMLCQISKNREFPDSSRETLRLKFPDKASILIYILAENSIQKSACGDVGSTITDFSEQRAQIGLWKTGQAPKE
jgi:hypothetical protein